MLDQVLFVHGLGSFFLGGFGWVGGGEGCDNVLDSRLLMNKWQTCSYACHGLGGSAGGGAVKTFLVLVVRSWRFMYME